MSNHEELPEDIKKQMTDFSSKLKNIQSLKGTPKQQAIVKQEKHLKRIKRLMETYQYSIQSGAFETGIQTHKSQYKQFQQQLTRLEKNLDDCRNVNGTENELFKNKNKSNKNVDYNNRDAVVMMGDQAQAQGQAALGRIIRNVHQMDNQANNIGIELDRQIKQLDLIYDELSDTQTTLKRAEKHLKYFAKQIYTDRIMICLIVIIAIAIIVIIALAIAGKTPKALAGK